MKISELVPNQGNVNITGTIKEVGEVKEFTKFGQAGRVSTATLEDESGSVTLTLWNDQIDQVKEGDKVEITNGYVKEWQGDKQISTGKFGSLKVL